MSNKNEHSCQCKSLNQLQAQKSIVLIQKCTAQRHLLNFYSDNEVCYPIESMSQFKYKPRVQSQFESPKYISNSHSHPSNLSQTGSIMSAHAQYRLCTCSVKGKHDTKI